MRRAPPLSVRCSPAVHVRTCTGDLGHGRTTQAWQATVDSAPASCVARGLGKGSERRGSALSASFHCATGAELATRKRATTCSTVCCAGQGCSWCGNAHQRQQTKPHANNGHRSKREQPCVQQQPQSLPRRRQWQVFVWRARTPPRRVTRTGQHMTVTATHTCATKQQLTNVPAAALTHMTPLQRGVAQAPGLRAPTTLAAPAVPAADMSRQRGTPLLPQARHLVGSSVRRVNRRGDPAPYRVGSLWRCVWTRRRAQRTPTPAAVRAAPSAVDQGARRTKHGHSRAWQAFTTGRQHVTARARARVHLVGRATCAAGGGRSVRRVPGRAGGGVKGLQRRLSRFWQTLKL